MSAPKFTPSDIALASKPCERKGKPGVVCAMTPSPVRYCATCAARIAIGNEGLEQVKQARSALGKAVVK